MCVDVVPFLDVLAFLGLGPLFAIDDADLGAGGDAMDDVKGVARQDVEIISAEEYLHELNVLSANLPVNFGTKMGVEVGERCSLYW